MRISDWSSDVCSSDLKLRALFKAVPVDIEETLRLIGPLLSLTPGDAGPPAEDGASDRLLELLVGAIAALARRRPLLTISWDLHWIDPTSLELPQAFPLPLGRPPILLPPPLPPEQTTQLQTWKD